MPGLYFTSGIDKGFEKDIARMVRSVIALSNSVKKETAAMSNSYDRLNTTIRQTFTVIAVKRFVNELIEIRSEIRGLEIAFTSMLKSKSAADKLMREIIQTASTTPFSIKDIADNARKLMAYGESVETVISTTRRLGDLASGVSTDIGGLSLAYGQVMNKGKLMTQELYQFTERGVALIPELSKVLKVEEKDIAKLIENGKVGFKDLQQAIFNLTAEGGKFYNLMAQNSAELKGRVSNLGDQYTMMMNDMAASSNTVLNAGITGISLLMTHWEDLVHIIGTAVAAYGAYKAVVMSIAAIEQAKMIGEAIQLTMMFRKELGLATAAQQAFNMTALANPYALVAASLAAVVTGLVLFSDRTSDADKRLQELQTTISDAIAEQTKELESLKSSVNKVNASDEVRANVIMKLNTLYGKELDAVIDMTSGNMQLVDSIDKIIAKKKLQTEIDEKEKAKQAALVRQSKIQDIAMGKAEDTEGGLLSFMESGQVVNGTFVRNAIIKEFNENKQFIEKTNAELEDLMRQAFPTKPPSIEKPDNIAMLRVQIKTLQEDREFVLRKDVKSVQNYNDKILALQKELDDLLGRSGVADRQAKKDRTASFAALEAEFILKNTITQRNLGYDKTMTEKYQMEMLKNEEEYINKKLAIAEEEIDKARLAQDLLSNQQQQKRLEQGATLAELLNDYKKYELQKKALQEEYQKKAKELADAGYGDNAEIVTEKGRAALQALEDTFLSQSEAYQRFLKKELPSIVEEGSDSIMKAMDGLLAKLEDSALSPGETSVLVAMIEELKTALHELKETPIELSDKTSLEDTLGTLSEIHSSLKDIKSLVIGDSNSVLSGIIEDSLDATGGILSMVGAVQSLSMGLSGLEKASAILTVITATLTIMNALANAGKRRSIEADKSLAKELSYHAAINEALIKNIALYKEGSELFSSDTWGSALSGLTAYNSALENQKWILDEIQENSGVSRKSKKFLGITWESQGTAMRNERIKSQKSEAMSRDTDIERALASIRVTTKDRSKIANAVGFDDKDASLLDLYPKIVDSEGKIRKAILETVIADADVSAADKERLDSLLQNLNTMEEAYMQFANFISSTFNGLGDSVTEAMQKAYESSGNSLEGISQAIDSVGIAMGEMIENFTRQTLEAAFLQPYMLQINETTKQLGEQYARGAITSDAMSKGIIEALSLFYRDVKDTTPLMLEAIAAADKLALEAGFDSAFNADTEIAGNAKKATAALSTVVGNITENTGTELVGVNRAIMLSNERIYNKIENMHEMSVRKLALLSAIKQDTAHLQTIADNTKKTADRLGNI